MFWRQFLKQYDIDESGDMSRLEISSMLDSLGSTLSSQTINSFFTRFGKDPFEGSITIPQAVQCLETEICKPQSERKRLTSSPNEADTAPSTPTGLKMDGPLPLDRIDFSGPSHLRPNEDNGGLRPGPFDSHQTEGTNLPLHHVAGWSDRPQSSRHPSNSSEDGGEDSSSGGSEEARERVINIRNCPLCHRPRLSSKAEVDIVTHIALCASQDWGRMDKIVVGNFVTASQAQRKWYTKILGKLSSGDYKLGAVSTSLLVQFGRLMLTNCNHPRRTPQTLSCRTV
jgi:phosphatidylserine decarboxylase